MYRRSNRCHLLILILSYSKSLIVQTARLLKYIFTVFRDWIFLRIKLFSGAGVGHVGGLGWGDTLDFRIGWPGLSARKSYLNVQELLAVGAWFGSNEAIHAREAIFFLLGVADQNRQFSDGYL